MILQAYDFLELNKKENCALQIGGSDQWGNIVNGTELIKRHSNKQAYGLTTPLITLASGSKMGKTETGAIWLDKKLLSPYDYWQFWRNIDDRDVVKFLKMFTDLNVDEINKIKDEDINQLKIKLANEATSMLHGKDEALSAEKTAKKTFEENSLGENLPSIDIQLKDGSSINIIDLIIFSKIENSKSEIRRLIKAKGIKINNETVNDEKFLIQKKLFDKDSFLKLSIGKKKHLKIKLS
jgi:tyrosyl-tRNA synthetase